MSRISGILIILLVLYSLLLTTYAQEATPELSPTWTPFPTFTPTVTPNATLLRNPTGEQLYSYLLYYEVGYSSTNPSSRPSYYWVLNAQQLYRDINGDEEDDLIVFSYTNVVVMVWQGNQYSEPLVQSYYAGREPGGRVLFEDWTGDAIPEVIYGTQFPHTGTETGGSRWVRAVIHCDLEACQLIWEGQIQDVHISPRTITLYRSTIEFDDNATFTYTTEGFYLRLVGVNAFDNPNYPDFIRYATTEAIYEWDGSFFTRLEEREIAPQEILSPITNLQATMDDQIASIEITLQESDYPYLYGDLLNCQLMVNDNPIGEEFLCEDYFTEVEWRDVTNDGEPELMVTTVTTSDPMNGCIQRYVMIYQYDGSMYRQIANVGGCFVDADLIGVELEDIDGDGQTEIRAVPSLSVITPESGCSANALTIPSIEGVARCWWELNNQVEIYRWDGQQFMLSEVIAR